jgi:hypothetical protein
LSKFCSTRCRELRHHASGALAHRLLNTVTMPSTKPLLSAYALTFSLVGCATDDDTYNTSNAAAHVVTVRTASALSDAIANSPRGSTIVIDDAASGGRGIAAIVVKNRDSAGLTIKGLTPDSVLNGIKLVHSSGFTFQDLRIGPGPATPPGDPSRDGVGLLHVDITQGSSDITFDRLNFEGISEDRGVHLFVDDSSSDITIQHSRVHECGNGDRWFGRGGEDACFRLFGTRIAVLDTDFTDHWDGMMITTGGDHVTISGNTFEDVIRGRCNLKCTRGTGPNDCRPEDPPFPAPGHTCVPPHVMGLPDGTTYGDHACCPHNDLVIVTGGDTVDIDHNTFGYHENGTAQLFVSGTGNTFKDLHVSNNLFTNGSGPSVMGTSIYVSGNNRQTGTVIENNTILTGDTSSLLLESQPITIARNVLWTMNRRNIRPTTTFAKNLMVDGTTADASDTGPSVAGQPSHLVDAAGSRGPDDDLRGLPRPVGTAKDKGAFEKQSGEANDLVARPAVPNITSVTTHGGACQVHFTHDATSGFLGTVEYFVKNTAVSAGDARHESVSLVADAGDSTYTGWVGVSRNSNGAAGVVHDPRLALVHGVTYTFVVTAIDHAANHADSPAVTCTP